MNADNGGYHATEAMRRDATAALLLDFKPKRYRRSGKHRCYMKHTSLKTIDVPSRYVLEIFGGINILNRRLRR